MLKKFAALSFCGFNNVIDRYNFLGNLWISDFENNETHQEFLKYLKNTWVDSVVLV